MKANQDIRDAMKNANVKQWELAKAIGISESYVCRKLRTELPEEEKTRVLKAIFVCAVEK